VPKVGDAVSIFFFPRVNMPYKYVLAVQNDCICTKPRKQAYRDVSTNLTLNRD
jgi:hypothetical protein